MAHDHGAVSVRGAAPGVPVEAAVAVRAVRGAAPTSDSSDYHGFVRRILRGYSRRVTLGDVDDLRDLATLRDEVDAVMVAAVRGLREAPASLTWEQIGSALGITRQAAQQRYGS